MFFIGDNDYGPNEARVSRTPPISFTKQVELYFPVTIGVIVYFSYIGFEFSFICSYQCTNNAH